MAQLRQDYQLYREANSEILVAGPDNSASFQRFWEERDLQFIGLPDPEHRILNLFGQEVNLFKLGRMPAMVVIDQKGIVRFAHYGHQMADIPENEEVLGLLGELNREHREE